MQQFSQTQGAHEIFSFFSRGNIGLLKLPSKYLSKLHRISSSAPMLKVFIYRAFQKQSSQRGFASFFSACHYVNCTGRSEEVLLSASTLVIILTSSCYAEIVGWNVSGIIIMSEKKGISSLLLCFYKFCFTCRLIQLICKIFVLVVGCTGSLESKIHNQQFATFRSFNARSCLHRHHDKRGIVDWTGCHTFSMTLRGGSEDIKPIDGVSFRSIEDFHNGNHMIALEKIWT
jgi:hypothetical protein